MERNFEMRKSQNLENLFTSNNEGFWNFLKQFRYSSSRQTDIPKNFPLIHKFRNHYEDYYKNQKIQTRISLHKAISLQEINEVIKYL